MNPPTKSLLVDRRRISDAERERLRALPDAATKAKRILWRVHSDLRPFLGRAKTACPSLLGHEFIAEDLSVLTEPADTYVLDGDQIVALAPGSATRADFATADLWRRAKTAEIVDFTAFLAFQRGIDLRADALATLKALDVEPCGWLLNPFPARDWSR